MYSAFLHGSSEEKNVMKYSYIEQEKDVLNRKNMKEFNIFRRTLIFLKLT